MRTSLFYLVTLFFAYAAALSGHPMLHDTESTSPAATEQSTNSSSAEVYPFIPFSRVIPLEPRIPVAASYGMEADNADSGFTSASALQCPGCPNNMVLNGDFLQGAADWIDNTGSPQYITSDFCGDDGAVQIWGNRDVGESIRQDGVNFVQGRTYSISFCARFLPQSSTTTPYVQLGFTASNGPLDPFTSGFAYNIGATSSSPGSRTYIDQTEWLCFTLPDWTAPQNFSDLIVNAFNAIPDNQGGNTIVSWARLDNICIQDVEACEIVCPDDITVPNNLGLCSAEVDLPAPVLEGNCEGWGPVLVPAQTVFPVGCTTVTWVYQGPTGLERSCSIDVCVEDTEAPVVSCAGISVDVSNGPITLAPGAVGTATDNCGVVSETLTPDTFDCADACGNVMVTYTASDAAGNTSSCTAMVNVNEFTDPVITCPDDINIDCTEDHEDLRLTGMATATDNCTASPTITSFDLVGIGDPCDIVIERTWTARDDCGNTSSCVQTIHKLDTSPPVVTRCPDDVELQGMPNAEGDCFITTDLTLPTATDDCTNINYSYVLSGATSDSGTDLNLSVNLNQGTTTVTWTLTDECGNSTDCVYQIHFICIGDTCPRCPNNLVQNSDFQQGSTSWINNTATPQFIQSDYCGDPGAVQMWGNQDIGESIRQTGVNLVQGNTYRITFCGRFLPQSTTTTPYAQIGFTASNGMVNPFTGGGTTIGATAATPGGTLPYLGEDQTEWMCYTLPVWTAPQNFSDLTVHVFNAIPDNQGGNTIVSWARIDNICIREVDGCEVVCPDDITVPNDRGLCTAEVTLPVPILEGNCDEWGPVAVPAQTVFPVGCTTVSWIYQGPTGMQRTCSIDVCVEDTEAPVVSCAGISVDVSNGPITLAPGAVGTATDNCGVVSETLTPDTFDCADACGNVMVTYTASDAAGNTSSCTAMVNVNEFTDPVITCPADIDIDCNDDHEDLRLTGMATATDNCTASPTITSFDLVGIGDPCDIVIERTWTATDDCGNTSSCVQTIHKLDTSPPVLISCPQDIVIVDMPDTAGDCQIMTTLPLPLATDNCNDLTYNYVSSGWPTISGTETDLDVTLNQGVTTFTWTIGDGCDNPVRCVYNVNFICVENTCPRCPNNLVQNGDFQQGSAIWIDNTESPQYPQSDYCGDPGAVQMWGNRDLGESIRQQNVNFEQGKTYSITFCARFVAQGNSRPYAQIGFTASNSAINPFSNSSAYNIGVTAASPGGSLPYIDQPAWMCYSLPLWTALQDYSYLTVNVFNAVPNSVGNPNTVSWARIDNICIREVDGCEIVCPDDITVPNDRGLCTAEVTLPTPTLVGNCDEWGPVAVPAQTVFPVGCTTVSWIYQGPTGMQRTCSIDVCVEDTEAPASPCPADITVTVPQGSTGANVPYTLIEMDNCGMVTVVPTSPAPNQPGDLFPLGCTAVDLEATDPAGNSTPCSFQICVEETCNDCSDFTNDVDAGYYPPIITYGNPCIRTFIPRQLGPCDEVEWMLTAQGTTLTASSLGDDPVVFNLMPGLIYKVRMIVTRTLPDGTVCQPEDYEYLDSYYLAQCQPYRCEQGAVLLNGDFQNGLENWEMVAGTPVAPADEAGCDDTGYLRLSGNSESSDMAAQDVSELPDDPMLYGFLVSLCVRPPADLLPGTRLLVATADDPQQCLEPNGDCDLIGIYEMGDGGDDFAPQDPMFTKYMFNSIVFYVENDPKAGGMPAERSVVDIDNICIEPVIGVDVSELFTSKEVKVYPNPTTQQLTLAFSEPTMETYRLRVLDLQGRELRREQLSRGVQQHELDLGVLPGGVYLLELSNARGVWREKVVKQ